MNTLSNLPSLSGIRVLITRPEGQSDKLKTLFEQAGATVEVQPAIEILPPECWDEVDNAIDSLDSFEYVVFSSTNGVEMFLRRLAQREIPIETLNSKAVAAVGVSTATELERRGVNVKIIPDEYRAENLANAILADINHRNNSSTRYHALLLRASRGRDVLKTQLTDAGINVIQTVVYRSVDVTTPSPEIVQKLQSGQIDWVVLTSSAIALSTLNMLGEWLHNVKIACISPITEATVVKAGFSVNAVANPYTMEGLVQSVKKMENGKWKMENGNYI